MRTTTVLLDAGGVILDESEAERVWADAMVRLLGPVVHAYDHERYAADAAEAVAAFSPSVRQYVLWKHTRPDRTRFDELWSAHVEDMRTRHPSLKLMAGVEEEIRSLTDDFGLVIAGQYGRELLDLLEQHELLGCFASHLTQDDFDLTKPDPRYLERIVRAVGIEPAGCIMVGDRIDNDVVPAKQLGMKTIRIRTGLHRHQEARTPDELPDSDLDSVRGLAATVRAVSARR
ncbi:MAG: HAD family hydrolase [Verrucomicrobia bacterium]|nr:HAD family hydrolase [Verrucomicrobiota bacterium]